MAAELTAVLDAQREFVANASHQMRTPLTGLRLRLEALAAGPPPDPEAELALREVDRMSDLVADLLVLARAGVPPRSVPSRPTSPSRPAPRPTAGGRSPRTASRRSRFDAPRRPVVVGADPSDVAIVLDNLIENAIVYSPSGCHGLGHRLAERRRHRARRGRRAGHPPVRGQPRVRPLLPRQRGERRPGRHGPRPHDRARPGGALERRRSSSSRPGAEPASPCGSRSPARRRELTEP